jgi:hypothetical protein
MRTIYKLNYRLAKLGKNNLEWFAAWRVLFYNRNGMIPIRLLYPSG